MPADPEQHPEQVGPYGIESRLGAGGMGTVYLGRHDETGDLAAVKVLPASLAREEGFVARFEREIDALRKVWNPHIVDLLESGVDGDRHYYAMEYVEGETISARLYRDRRMPWQEVVDVSIQVCSALKAAHDAGVIHRDLKPSNLMLRPDGIAKLTDFGIAHVFAGTQLTATGGIIGTAEFMSPEQAAGKRVTKQSDLYSLGAVMYCMLTGRPPFTGKSARAVIHKHLNERCDSAKSYVPDLPVWLDDLLAELLAKNPEERPPDAYVLLRRLETIRAKVDVSAADDATRTAHGDDDATAATVVVGDEQRGPGSATLMRDLVKAEVENQQRRSTLGEILDNTWVLLGLLAAVVGFVTWMMWPNPDQPDVELSPDSAVKRFLQQAQRERTAGNPAAAERTLLALKRLLEETGEHPDQLDLVETRLAAVRRQLADRGADTLLTATLERIGGAIDAGHLARARSLLTDASVLYADDPVAAAGLERLRTRIDDAAETSPDPKPDS